MRLSRISRKRYYLVLVSFSKQTTIKTATTTTKHLNVKDSLLWKYLDCSLGATDFQVPK